jgi:hypothetical protein
MRRLHYSGAYVLTPDDVCKALLRYARALADTQSSDVVAIPVLEEGGIRGAAHFLIGPASQLYSTPAPESITEIEDAELVEELQRRTRRLQPSVADWPDMMDDADLRFDTDDY